MRQIRALRIAAVAAGIALMATGCGATGKELPPAPPAPAPLPDPITGLQIMVPNTAGGGYDTTARAAAKVLDDEKIATNTEVFNLAGAGGTVGLARVVNEKGNGDLAMLMGLGVVGASYTNKSESKLTDTTPLAKLIEEPGAIMVGKDSPYKTIDDLVTAWKADPGSISVGGGSSPGGPDHLLPMQLAGAVGIDATKVELRGIDANGSGELHRQQVVRAAGGGTAAYADGAGIRLPCFDEVADGLVGRILADHDRARLFDELGQRGGVRQLGFGLVRVARAHHSKAHQHGQVAVALLIDHAGQPHGSAGAGEVEHLGVRGNLLVVENLRGGTGGGVVTAAGGVGNKDLQPGDGARGSTGAGRAGTGLSGGTAAGGHQGDAGSDGGNSQCADLAHGVPLLTKTDQPYLAGVPMLGAEVTSITLVYAEKVKFIAFTFPAPHGPRPRRNWRRSRGV